MEEKVINEFDFFDDADLLDIIEEVSKQKDLINDAKNSLKTIFCHMIKYQYNPRRQTKSWVATIIREYKLLSKMKKLNKFITDEILNESYNNGRNEAISEDEDNVIENKSQIYRPYNWNIEFVTNINSIIDFLHKYESDYRFDNYDLDIVIQRGLK